MKNIIIGKNGFIAKQLLKKGPYITTSSIRSKYSLFLDLLEPETFEYQEITPDTNIILLSAISSPDVCKNDFEKAYKVNVIGTKYFIRKALGNGARVLFFSSDVVYGDSKLPVDENSTTSPFGEYAKMKDEVEKFFENEKNFKVFRLSYVLSKEDKFLSYLKRCVDNNKVAEVFHPFTRKVIYIDDVLEAIECILDRWEIFDNQKFNICGEENISRKAIADFYNEAIGHKLQYTAIKPDERFWEARPKNVNITSLYLEKLLGKKPIKIKDAINQIVKTTL